MIRRRTLWFKLTAFGWGHVPRRPGSPLLGSWEKATLVTRTMRGVWGEVW